MTDAFDKQAQLRTGPDNPRAEHALQEQQELPTDPIQQAPPICMGALHFDVTLWSRLPDEIKKRILEFALEDSGNMLRFSEDMVTSAMNDALSRTISGYSRDMGLMLMFAHPALVNVSVFAREIIYGQSRVVIDFDEDDTIRLPPRDARKFTEHLSVMIGAHERHFDFVRLLASGCYGFGRLDQITLSIHTQSLWDTADVRDLSASVQTLSSGLIKFRAQRLHILFAVPDLDSTLEDDEYEAAKTAFIKLHRAIFAQITIEKHGWKEDPVRIWQERSDKCFHQMICYAASTIP